MTNQPINILAKTRAEEHEADVWGEFFIPPYFNRLSLHSATKSSYIVGKRGCGKTMLLKYLDYHTAFSRRRTNIPQTEISHVGIYWRVDTQFCNSLYRRGIEEHDWISIFESYFAIAIGIEIIKSLGEIAGSAFVGFSPSDLDCFEFSSATDFHDEYPKKANKLAAFLEAKRRAFAFWSSNISTTTRPTLPPGKIFLEALIGDIRQQTTLESASFFIYVDEVENLVPYQRRVLNSFLKHSQRPLIVSFTSKELSNETATTGPESINATHDFNPIQLDELANESEYKIFFAEVFLANIDLASSNDTTHLLSLLRDPKYLGERSQGEHKKIVYSAIRKIFPSKKNKEIAQSAVNEPRIFNILKEKFEKALSQRKTNLVAEAFLAFNKTPEAIVVAPSLLSRPRNSPEEILTFLERYNQLPERTSDPKDWIHNNLVGALLELYRPYGQICPIYSGYDTFFTMANMNLRHFLILCYRAFEIADLSDESREIVSLETQARAAYEAADQLIREIKTFGPQGERLRIFTLRLGSVFKTLQSAPAMSEPEQNQFTINSGSRVLDEEEAVFIAELKKYGIIEERLETKTKNRVGSDIIDYQLNPIYSPYFQISYRRKRKISLSIDEFHVLALGTEDEYKNLSSKIFRAQDSVGTQPELWE